MAVQASDQHVVARVPQGLTAPIGLLHSRPSVGRTHIVEWAEFEPSDEMVTSVLRNRAVRNWSASDMQRPIETQIQPIPLVIRLRKGRNGKSHK